MSAGPNAASAVKRWIRLRLDAFPPLYMLVLSRVWRPDVVTAVTPGVRLLIEGYPRSGNTFTRHAYAVSQPTDADLASHVHASANVITAVRRDIPAVVLVRRPEDAVASAVIKLAEIPLATALREWVAYHERIAPYRDRLLVVRFEDATGDFPGVVRRINDRFGLGLAVPASHEEVRAAAFESIAAKRRREVGETLPEGFVTNMPDPGRDERKRGIAAAYRGARFESLRRRADAAYRLLVDEPASGV